jgi:hypothetical protein
MPTDADVATCCPAETGCARPGCKGGHARSGGDAGLPSCAVRPELPLPRVAPSDTHWGAITEARSRPSQQTV